MSRMESIQLFSMLSSSRHSLRESSLSLPLFLFEEGHNSNPFREKSDTGLAKVISSIKQKEFVLSTLWPFFPIFNTL